jgi:hypothetical protein
MSPIALTVDCCDLLATERLVITQREIARLDRYQSFCFNDNAFTARHQDVRCPSNIPR